VALLSLTRKILGQKYTLIDTAGIRRKRSTHEKVEIFSILKAKEAVERSHVVVLVLDAHEGITEQDATLLGMSNCQDALFA
jgi:GTP-binding protein